MITISEAEEVLQRLRDEVKRVQEQIIKSGAVTFSNNSNTNYVDDHVDELVHGRDEEIVDSNDYDSDDVNKKDDKEKIVEESKLEHSTSIVNTSNLIEAHHVKRKSGLLLHLVRKSLFSSKENWVLHYFTVDEQRGISWYDIKENNKEYEVTNVLSHVPFWCTSYNSRGSRFKRACVCWPILLECDYPSLTNSKIATNSPIQLLHASVLSSSSVNTNNKAGGDGVDKDGQSKKEILENNSPSLYCFGIEYYKESKQAHEMIVLASVDAQTRKEWVCFLSQYMDWYIPPGRELEISAAGMQRVCKTPMHRSVVLDGEAPRSPSEM